MRRRNSRKKEHQSREGHGGAYEMSPLWGEERRDDRSKRVHNAGERERRRNNIHSLIVSFEDAPPTEVVGPQRPAVPGLDKMVIPAEIIQLVPADRLGG
jgi:hypothetical protein